MTHRMFDPINLGQYPSNAAPKMLHFQYKGSEDIFRYILVERIPIGQINTSTRRKVDEEMDEEIVCKQYSGERNEM